MKHNVGGVDRVARLVVGLGIIGWGIYEQNWWGAIGILPLLTAVIAWCPAYFPMGISTGKKD